MQKTIKGYEISIHVPTRGTTRTDWSCTCTLMDFNPRSHKGNDGLRKRKIFQQTDFNPRSHKGNDCPAIDISRAVRYFNPRSHKGNDRASPNICKFWRISIHVPTRGTTRRYMPDPWHRAFQSTFPQGERHYPVFAAISKRLISIHVPTRGTTLPFQCCFSEFRISIHVPTRGTTANISKFQKKIVICFVVNYIFFRYDLIFN